MNLNLFYSFSSVKPTLKKVAKHENKFAKLQSQAAKYQFRNQLKTVKKQEYTLKEPEEDVSINFSCIYGR